MIENIKRFAYIPKNTIDEDIEEKEVIYIQEYECFGFKYKGEIHVPYIESKEKYDNHINSLEFLHFKKTNDVLKEPDGYYIDNDNKNLMIKNQGIINSVGKFKTIDKGDVHYKHLSPELRNTLTDENKLKFNDFDNWMEELELKLTELYYDLIIRHNNDKNINYTKYFIDMNNFKNSTLQLDNRRYKLKMDIEDPSLNIIKILDGAETINIGERLYISNGIDKSDILKVISINNSDVTVEGLTNRYNKDKCLVYKSLIFCDLVNKSLTEDLLPYKNHINNKTFTLGSYSKTMRMKGKYKLCKNNGITINDTTYFAIYNDNKLKLCHIKDDTINERDIIIDNITYLYMYKYKDNIRLLYCKNDKIYEYDNLTSTNTELFKGTTVKVVVDYISNIHYYVTNDTLINYYIINNGNIIKNEIIVSTLGDRSIYDTYYDSENNIIYALLYYSNRMGQYHKYNMHLFKSDNNGYSFKVKELEGLPTLEKDATLQKINNDLVIYYNSDNKGIIGSMLYEENVPRYIFDNGTKGEDWTFYEINHIDSNKDMIDYEKVDKTDSIIGYDNKILLSYKLGNDIILYKSNLIDLKQNNLTYVTKISKDDILDYELLNGKYMILYNENEIDILYDDSALLKNDDKIMDSIKSKCFMLSLKSINDKPIKNFNMILDSNYIHLIEDIKINLIGNKYSITINKEDLDIKENRIYLKYNLSEPFILKEVNILINNPYNELMKINNIIGTVY